METYASVGHNQVSVWDTMARAVGRDGRGAWDATGGACGTRWAGRMGRDGWGAWDATGGARGTHGTRRAAASQMATKQPVATSHPWRYHPSRQCCSSSASCLPSSLRGPEVAWVEIYTKPVHVQVMLE